MPPRSVRMAPAFLPHMSTGEDVPASSRQPLKIRDVVLCRPAIEELRSSTPAVGAETVSARSVLGLYPLPSVLGRASRTDTAHRAPTAVVIPSDFQEDPYEAPNRDCTSSRSVLTCARH